MRRTAQWWRRRKDNFAAPTPPTFANITTTTVSIGGSWHPGATSYELQRSTDQLTWTTRSTSASPFYDETGLTAGVTYFWRRRVSDGVRTSPWSVVDAMQTLQQAGPPETPTVAPRVTAAGATGMTVDWDAVLNATSYQLQRSATSATSGYATAYTGTALQHVASGLTPSTTYYWRYAALNADGQSDYSPIVSQPTGADVTVPATPTTAPAASGVDADSATLTMGAIDGADTYILSRSPNGVDSWSRRYLGPDRVFLDTGLAAATDYYYRYTVANAAGQAGWSPNRKITTASVSVGNVRPYSAKYIRERSGVRVAANEGSGEYGPQNADAICRRVASMGLGHIRGQFNGNTANTWATACKTHGLKWLMTSVPEARTNTSQVISNQTVADTRAKIATIKNSALYSSVCAGLEGPNEPNHNRDGSAPAPDWYVQATEYQQAIWQTAKSVTSSGAPSPIRSIPIVGPSLHDIAVENSNGRHWELLKTEGIEQWCDMIGLHTYPGGSFPQRKLDVGLQAGVKGRLEYIKATFGNDVAVWCTEWGYHNARLQTGHRPVPFSVAATYAPRGFLQFITTVKPNGIVRNLALTYFESLDNPNTATTSSIGGSAWYNSSNHEIFFGMYNVPTASVSTWTAKAIVPSLTAFLGTMQDPAGTAGYTPNLVTCEVATTATGAELQWQVVATKAQSDAGTATLWIWRDKDIWNRDTLAFITVQPVTVSVTDRVGRRSISVDGSVQRLDLR